MKKILSLLLLATVFASVAFATPSLWIKKHPNAQTLLAKAYAESCPAGYEAATEAEASAYIAAEVAAGWVAAPAPADPAPVPETVTRRQLKEWLIDHDKLDAVVAVIAAISDAKQRAIANNWWTESTDFRRDHPLVAALGAAIGMSSADIDTAFIAAAQL